MAKGWITLNRQIVDHWVWKNHEYAFAWIDLLLMVNHENKKILVNNTPTTIKRGQTLTSIYKLAQRWQWSRKRIYSFLRALEQDGMIKRESTTRYTIVTIVNYGKYQDVGTTKDTTKVTTKDTTKVTTKELQAIPKQQYINNDKQINNETKPSADFSSDEEEEGEGEDRWYTGAELLEMSRKGLI